VLEVGLSDALLASLQMIQARPSISPAAADAKSQLGMLMDVELVVTMRFGGRRMLLKDIPGPVRGQRGGTGSTGAGTSRPSARWQADRAG
jgi:hypothetical protein